MPSPEAREGGLASRPPPDAREGRLATKPPPDARKLASIGQIVRREGNPLVLASPPRFRRFPMLTTLSSIENQPFWKVFQSERQ